MKKIFYILASAIVALGAVACDNQDLDNIAPEANGEGLSFTATIDETKTDLNGSQTIWEKDDVVTINGFEFVHQGDANNTFKCEKDGVLSLVGQENLVAWYNEDGVDSSKGTAGAQLKGVGSFADDKTATFTFEVMSAFLKFTSAIDVTLAGEGLFTNLASSYKGTDVYVAVNVDVPATFSCTVAGQTKTKEGFTAKAGKIYNLGEVDLGEAHDRIGVVGGFQGWDSAKTLPLYLILNSNTYVARNVKLDNSGFKFYGETSKKVTIEHPEVTGGEQGYLFLKPNSNWTQANARFAAYFFGDGEEWISMTDANKDGIYAVKQPSKTYPNVIFCRMNPSASANNWNNKWNQTGDLAIPTNGNNLFTVPSGSWDGATTTWSKHTVVEHQDAWTEETVEITSHWMGKADSTDYLTAWAQCYSDNDGSNITVTNFNKTYDIYMNKEADQDWGFVVNYTIREHGSAAPELK